MKKIPLCRPQLGREEEEGIRNVLRSGWISQGPKVEEFEQQLARYLGCRYVCAVNSGTSALLLALRSLGIGQGDAVVVPAFTCAATALPVLETGAELIFADIDLANYNPRWGDIAKMLNRRVKAVVLTHMFGAVAEAPEIAQECKQRKLLLIEDAALAFGAKIGTRAAGTFGDVGCFSFHPRKIITTGEGGAVCTNNAAVASRIYSDRNYGSAHSAWARYLTSDGSPRGFNRLAFNMKLTDIQAAIGLAQLDRLDHFLSKRRSIAHDYTKALNGTKQLLLPSLTTSAHRHVFQAFVCLWKPDYLDLSQPKPAQLKRAEASLQQLKAKMTEQNIAISEAAQYLPELPVFRRKFKQPQLPNARLAAHLAFALPIFPEMNRVECARVVKTLKAVIEAL